MSYESRRGEPNAIPPHKASAALRQFCLWFVWLAWGLALVLWTRSGPIDRLHYPNISGFVAVLLLTGCLLVLLILRIGHKKMRLMKKKALASKADSMKEANNMPIAAATQISAAEVRGVVRDAGVTAVRKDVFIAHGSRLSGLMEAEGSIVIEGNIEGNLRATHEVRVNRDGGVKGDIHASHIIINGLVMGRCYAGAITLLEEGRIEGDVFADELAIERGGVFIGQSSPPLTEQAKKGQPLDALKQGAYLDDKTLEGAAKKKAKEAQSDIIKDNSQTELA